MSTEAKAGLAPVSTETSQRLSGSCGELLLTTARLFPSGDQAKPPFISVMVVGPRRESSPSRRPAVVSSAL